MPIADIFFIFLHCSQLFWGGIVPWPTLGDPLQKSETDSEVRPIFFRDYYAFETKNRQNRDRFKMKFFFRDHYVFGQKLDKIGTDLNCKFFLSLFDRVSFRSSVVRSSVVRITVGSW